MCVCVVMQTPDPSGMDAGFEPGGVTVRHDGSCV